MKQMQQFKYFGIVLTEADAEIWKPIRKTKEDIEMLSTETVKIC